MYDKYSLSVIMPVYNESRALERAVGEIASFLKANFNDYEIVIIESGSTDGSAEICDRLAGAIPNIKLIHEQSRNGFGAALRAGYMSATKDLLWLVTADLPFALEAVFKALPLFSKYDCVLSYRSGDNRKLRKKIQSLVYNTMVKNILGLKVRHVNSAFKVFKKEVIRDMPLISKGWLIESEIIYRLKIKGISYPEIPVELIDRTVGTSSINFFTVFSMLREFAYFLRNKDLRGYKDEA